MYKIQNQHISHNSKLKGNWHAEYVKFTLMSVIEQLFNCGEYDISLMRSYTIIQISEFRRDK